MKLAPQSSPQLNLLQRIKRGSDFIQMPPMTLGSDNQQSNLKSNGDVLKKWLHRKQLVRAMFPNLFEFSEHLLIKLKSRHLADHSKTGHFGPLTSFFSVWFSDHHSNTGSFDNRTQIYHSNTRYIYIEMVTVQFLTILSFQKWFLQFTW